MITPLITCHSNVKKAQKGKTLEQMDAFFLAKHPSAANCGWSEPRF